MSSTRMLAFVCLLGCSYGFAQVTSADKPNSPLPNYDIVSIKPNNSGDGHVSISQDNGKLLSQQCFGSHPHSKRIPLQAGTRSSGLTGPLRDARFDVKAKVLQPDNEQLSHLTRAQLGQMLQPILADRFHLKTHLEKRELLIYRLVREKDPAKITQTSTSSAQRR